MEEIILTEAQKNLLNEAFRLSVQLVRSTKSFPESLKGLSINSMEPVPNLMKLGYVTSVRYDRDGYYLLTINIDKLFEWAVFEGIPRFTTQTLPQSSSKQ